MTQRPSSKPIHITAAIALAATAIGCVSEPLPLESAGPGSALVETAARADVFVPDGNLVVLLQDPGTARGGRAEIRTANLIESERRLREALPTLRVRQGVRQTRTRASGGVHVTEDFATRVMLVESPSDPSVLRALVEHPSVAHVSVNGSVRVTLSSREIATSSTMLTGTQVRAWGIDSGRAPSQWVQGWTGGTVSVGLVESGIDLFGSSSEAHPDIDISVS